MRALVLFMSLGLVSCASYENTKSRHVASKKIQDEVLLTCKDFSDRDSWKDRVVRGQVRVSKKSLSFHNETYELRKSSPYEMMNDKKYRIYSLDGDFINGLQMRVPHDPYENEIDQALVENENGRFTLVRLHPSVYEPVFIECEK